MEKRILFFLLLALAGVPSSSFGDDFTRGKAAAAEKERQQLIARLSPAVIAVQAMPDKDSHDPVLRRGGGSGVIIDPRGYALSNFHVTKYGPVKVGMVDGKLHDAKVIAFDENSDIVLIKMEEEREFPYVKLGDSARVKVGDISLAMGNPFSLATDYKPTSTLGILSGTNRYLAGMGNSHTLVYTGIIQTDTPINPGNSGGPLFNREGELIGINGRISLGSSRRVNVGVGYAIPINTVKNFLSRMRRGHDASHGILGLALMDLKHVTVHSILPSSEAAEAGLRPGDEILEIDGKKPKDMYEAIHLICSQPAGSLVFMKVKRISPLGDSLIEEASYRIKLKARPLAMNMARNAKAVEIRNFDFVTKTEFISREEGAPPVIDQVMSQVRKINVDLIDEVGWKDGLIWTVDTRSGNDGQLGQVGDVITLFKQGNAQLVRSEFYGRNTQLSLAGFTGEQGWANDASAVGRLSDDEVAQKKDRYERRLCWYGKKSDPSYTVSIKKKSVEKNKRKCYLIAESYKGVVFHHFIDRITGIEIAVERLNKKGKIAETVNYSKWGRVGGKIVPLKWEIKDGSGHFVRGSRVHKVAYGMNLDPIIFEYQPGVYF